jgi:catechol 2,3-dioxygenase
MAGLVEQKKLAPKMAFAHMGLYVTNMTRMVEFYTDVLGFCISDRATIRGADLTFLTRDPNEHHQIVLVPGRDPKGSSTINQISFRVVTLQELRRLHAGLIERGVASPTAINHGGSWSIYFLDPEENRIDLFVQSPWYVPPVSMPLDLTLSDNEIHRQTEAMVLAMPGHMDRSVWREQMRHRLIDEGTMQVRSDDGR